MFHVAICLLKIVAVFNEVCFSVFVSIENSFSVQTLIASRQLASKERQFDTIPRRLKSARQENDNYNFSLMEQVCARTSHMHRDERNFHGKADVKI